LSGVDLNADFAAANDFPSLTNMGYNTPS